MATITSILSRISELTSRNGKNSIGKNDLFGLMTDMVKRQQSTELNMSNLSLRKIYASVAAMNADVAAPVGDDGEKVLKGQLVVISAAGADMGKVYRYSGSAWEYVGQIGDLSQKADETTLENSIALITGKNFFVNDGYINSDYGFAVPQVGSSNRYTEFIPLTQSNTLNCTNLQSAGSFIRQACFYSSRNEASFLSSYNADNNTEITLNSGNIPAGTKYVRLNCNTINVPVLVLDGINPNTKIVNDIVQQFVDSSLKLSLTRGDNLFKNDGYINGVNGIYVVQVGSSNRCTDFIPLVPTDKLNCTNLQTNDSFIRQANFYSAKSEASFISAYTSDLNTEITLDSSNIPAGTKYVRLNKNTTFTTVLTFNDAKPNTKLDSDALSIQEDVQNRTLLETGADLFTNIGYINKNTGELSPDAGYKCTNFLPLNSSQTIKAFNLIGVSLVRQANFYSDKKATAFMSAFTLNDSVDILLNKSNIPPGTKYVRLNTSVAKTPTVFTKIDTILNAIVPLKFNTAEWDTISPASGYSVYYGKYWNGSGFTNHNDFSGLVYPVIAGNKIRIRGNIFSGNNPIAVFFADENLGTHISDGVNKGSVTQAYYDFEETVPVGASFVLVQQSRILNSPQPFTEMVVEATSEIKSKKVIIIGDSFSQMAGYAGRELMILIKSIAPEYDIFNFGIGGEKTNEILARIGAFQMFVTPDNAYLSTDAQTGRKYFALPADTSTVNMGANSISNSWNTDKLNLLVQETITADCFPKYMIIDGIQCLLTLVGGMYYLNRVEAGIEEHKIYSGTQMIVSNMVNITPDDIVLLNVGANGGYTDNNDFMEQYKRLVDHLGTKKYIALNCHYAQIADPTALNSVTNSIIRETALRKAFGARYVNMREYFCTNALKDALDSGFWNTGTYPTDIEGEVHPTATDLTYMTNGMFAPMFWCNPNNPVDIIHMSRRTYMIYYKHIFNKIKALKYL